MSIEIDKGITIPSRTPVRDEVMPVMERLAVGDSFFSTASKSSLNMFAREAGIKVVIKRVESGHRVWRLE